MSRWVLLSYRVPREPSAPRIAIWRKLERLGVARLGDGLVALPADARTGEQVDWLAEEIIEAGGTAMVWLAQPASVMQERDIAAKLAAERAAEYQHLVREADAAQSGTPEEQSRTVRRLRDQLRRIARRDYFPPAERERAETAVRALATQAAQTDTADTADTARSGRGEGVSR